jgi:hypothetical protein
MNLSKGHWKDGIIVYYIFEVTKMTAIAIEQTPKIDALPN